MIHIILKKIAVWIKVHLPYGSVPFLTMQLRHFVSNNYAFFTITGVILQRRGCVIVR